MKNIDEILALPNETKVIIALGERLYQKSRNDKNFDSLNEYEKSVLYIEMLEAEVNNGGFEQYFYNHSGEYAHETVNALKQISANTMAGFLIEAIKIFPVIPIPKDLEARRACMKDLPKIVTNKWNDLDKEFFKYPDKLESLVIEFVTKNKKQFE